VILCHTKVCGHEEATVTSDHSLGPADESVGTAVLWVHPEATTTSLEGTDVLIGRGRTCAAQLSSAGVSRNHCRLSRNASGWIVRDLESKNGTFVNGLRVTEAPLSEQDVLRVGEWVGIFAQVDVAYSSRLAGPIVPNLIGGSKLLHAYEELVAVARSPLDVVLVGETGTGKEVFARKLHELSGRSGPLVSVNCAALPEPLAEGELFGYRKGAFTSAIRSSVGYLRSAHQGTLFLDEVVELDERIQAKLLRALEAREVTPLGEVISEKVDLRVVAAAQVPLAEHVESGRFRPDLYARLDGIEIGIPPIRQRREDVLPLFRHFLADRCKGKPPELDAAVAEKLCLYDWPRNVREIVQTAARVSVLHGRQSVLKVFHLPHRISAGTCPQESSPTSTTGQPTELRRSRAAKRLCQSERRNDHEMRLLTQALHRTGGNLSAAAKALGISRQRAYRLIDQRPGIEMDRLKYHAFKAS
jgi:transcriptional regulator with PAS, ATPase and Fis domain